MNITDSNLLRTFRARRAFASRNAGKSNVMLAASPAADEALLHGARQAAAQQARFTFGVARLDQALSRDGQPAGLPLAALHEIHAAETDDSSSAAAFALLMAERARIGAGNGNHTLLWARESRASRQQGFVYPPGLVDLGINPDNILYIEAQDPLAVLRAGADAARCQTLAAVIIELAGQNPKGWDLTASRRLSLSSQNSGVPVLCLRSNAALMPSAAYSRWIVASAPSTPMEANAPGHPAFDISLQRHRGGIDGLSARVEWNRDRQCFEEQGSTGQRQSDQKPADKKPADIGTGHALSTIGADRQTRRFG
jgi:protein ImuA